MQFFAKTFFVAAILLLAGCDNRPVLKSDGEPFGVGGITLGMLKSELEKKHELLSCNPDAAETAKCFVDDRKVKYDFFGVPVGFIAVKLPSPYTTIYSMHFAIKGGKVRKSDVERAWHIQGKCLGKVDIEDALKFDKETSGYFARSLDEFHLLPSGYEDFICLMPDHSFIKYDQYTDKNEAGVDIYYLKDVFVTNYGYVFKSREKYAAAKIEINQKTTESVGVESNPTTKLNGGVIDALNGDQSPLNAHAIAERENSITVVVRDGTLATLDQVVENSVVDTIQITNEKPDRRFCETASQAGRVVFTFTSKSKKTYQYAEGCWRKSDDGKILITGENFSSKEMFSFEKEKSEFSPTYLGKDW